MVVKIKRTPYGAKPEDRPHCIAPPKIAEDCRCYVGAHLDEDKNPEGTEGCLQVYGCCLFQKKKETP